MKFVLFLFFFAFTATAVSAFRVVTQNAQGTLACCPDSRSDATYFTDTQQCCFGVVVGVGSLDTFDCCGTDTLASGKSCCSRDDGILRSTDRPYDSSTQICCNGTVLSQSVSSPLSCCGTSTYNSANDLCCGTGNVFRNSVAAGNVCCGNNAIYNPTTDTCCVNALTGAGTATRGALTGTNAANPKDTCCGTTAYSQNTQFCCGTTVSNIPTGSTASDLDCCGTTAYLTASRVCCGTTLSSPATGKVPSDYACCGSRSYLISDSQCCSSLTSSNVVSLTQTCCGSNGYDPSTQLCCSDSVRSSSNGELSCCGTGTYNPSTQQCCIDKAVSATQTCCGNLGYDPSRQVCCSKADGTPVVNSDSSPPVKTSCCSDGNSYNPGTQACPCGRVISVTDDLSLDPNAITDCCDTRQYDTNTDFCCHPTKFVNETFSETKPVVFFSGLRQIAGYSCCYSDTDQSYNPGWQTCCEYEKRTGSGRNRKTKKKTKVVCGTSCCAGSRSTDRPKGYFAGYQFCCEGTTKDYTNLANNNIGNYACCGDDLYDADFQACCGDTTYDPTTQICCGTPSV